MTTSPTPPIHVAVFSSADSLCRFQRFQRDRAPACFAISIEQLKRVRSTCLRIWQGAKRVTVCRLRASLPATVEVFPPDALPDEESATRVMLPPDSPSASAVLINVYTPPHTAHQTPRFVPMLFSAIPACLGARVSRISVLGNYSEFGTSDL